MENNLFNTLYELDVKDKVEQKNGLNYLSWAYAWAEVKKIDEEANYYISMFGDKKLPYVYDEDTGYMVFTEMTIKGITHQMFLPVMDGANKTMLNHPYTYRVKEYAAGQATGNYIDKSVDKASMFDINKTIMRCLVKNIAMFGLGLKLYQGEDLPIVTTKEEASKTLITFGKHQGKTMGEIIEKDKNYIRWILDKTKDENLRKSAELLLDEKQLTEAEQQEMLTLINKMNSLVQQKNANYEEIRKTYKVNSSSEMSKEQLQDCIKRVEAMK